MNFHQILCFIEIHHKANKECKTRDPEDRPHYPSEIDECIESMKNHRLVESWEKILQVYENHILKKKRSREIFIVLALLTLIEQITAKGWEESC